MVKIKLIKSKMRMHKFHSKLKPKMIVKSNCQIILRSKLVLKIMKVKIMTMKAIMRKIKLLKRKKLMQKIHQVNLMNLKFLTKLKITLKCLINLIFKVFMTNNKMKSNLN